MSILKTALAMLIIADSRMPKPARARLQTLGNVLWMPPQDFTYQAIAAHPDIFFCQIDDYFVAAPNAPREILKSLLCNNISFLFGEKTIGAKHPETAYYNAVFTDSFFIHNTKLSDESLLKHAAGRKIIHTTQGYTRCNLLPLSDTAFLCSDRNMEKNLLQQNADVLYVHPDEIMLPGVRHGFIGGCCGIFDNTVVFIGSLANHRQGAEITAFLTKNNLNIIELYDGPLWDGGSILFC